MNETAVKMSRNNQITFIAPDGSDTNAPDPSFLHDLIMNAGDDYWQSGAGDAALWFDRDDGKRARLILIEDERAGFFLLYENAETGEYFYPKGQEGSNQSTTVYMGGEPLEISAEDFVTRDKAWGAVEYFVREGKSAPNLEWHIWQ